MATNAPDVMIDPLDAASNATLAPRSYYGQIEIDAWFCVLERGKGKIVYDPQQHSPDQRRTAIKIALLPLPEQNVQFALEREMIAESREWAGIVLPSLKALGVNNVREANGKWAKMQQVPSGRKYRNAKGQEKEATTFRFLALYPDKAACRAAYMADRGQAPEQEPAAPAPDNGDGDKARKLDVAKPFIAAFAKACGYDLERTKAACRTQRIIADAIDVESPEFAALVAAALAGGK